MIVGLISSNFRPEYKQAAMLAKTATCGSVMVFNYQPVHVAPNLELHEGASVLVFGQVETTNNTFVIKPHRMAKITSLVVSRDRIYITLELTDDEIPLKINDLPNNVCVFNANDGE